MYTVVTPAASQPITLADAKSYSRITSTSQDSVIESMIASAIDIAEEYALISFINTTWKLVLTEWPSDYKIRVGKGKVSSITHIKYFDVNGTEQTMDAADYYTNLDVWPARIHIPNPPELYAENPKITIQFVAGLGANAAAVPDRAKNALYSIVRHLYDNRSNGSDVMPEAAKRALDFYRNNLRQI